MFFLGNKTLHFIFVVTIKINQTFLYFSKHLKNIFSFLYLATYLPTSSLLLLKKESKKWKKKENRYPIRLATGYARIFSTVCLSGCLNVCPIDWLHPFCYHSRMSEFVMPLWHIKPHSQLRSKQHSWQAFWYFYRCYIHIQWWFLSSQKFSFICAGLASPAVSRLLCIPLLQCDIFLYRRLCTFLHFILLSKNASIHSAKR